MIQRKSKFPQILFDHSDGMRQYGADMSNETGKSNRIEAAIQELREKADFLQKFDINKAREERAELEKRIVAIDADISRYSDIAGEAGPKPAARRGRPPGRRGRPPGRRGRPAGTGAESAGEGKGKRGRKAQWTAEHAVSAVEKGATTFNAVAETLGISAITATKITKAAKKLGLVVIKGKGRGTVVSLKK